MQSSDLDQRILIEQRAAVGDDLGQESTTWQEVAPVWANIRVKAARDFQGAEAQQASTVIGVRIRKRADVLANMRLIWNGTPFDIVGEPVVVDRQWLQFDAASGVRNAVA